MISLKHIERGTKLSIVEDTQPDTAGKEYKAVFRHTEGDKTFVVQCVDLCDNFERVNPRPNLKIIFKSEPNMYTFTGRAVEKQRDGHGLILLEQLSNIGTINSRRYIRDEFRLNVMLYGLPEAMLANQHFKKPQNEPEMADVTYDISAGGLCIVSNTHLVSKHDPYYLVEFSLGEKDKFLLPAKLVRRSNYNRTKVGKNDYGFQFIFDNMPDEKGRLSRSILNKKLSFT